MNRCAWGTSNPLMIEYHDTEWGVPLHDDRRLFEFLILEGMQAGLSWSTILKRMQNARFITEHHMSGCRPTALRFDALPDDLLGAIKLIRSRSI